MEMETSHILFAFGSAGKAHMRDSIKVLILGDDAFCHKMRLLLNAAEDITVVGEINDRQQALALIRENYPDVILLGINASRADCLQIVGEIYRLFPQIKIIILDDNIEEQFALDVLRKGALGYLLKKSRSKEVISAIHSVIRGKAILSPGIAGRILDELHPLNK